MMIKTVLGKGAKEIRTKRPYQITLLDAAHYQEHIKQKSNYQRACSRQGFAFEQGKIAMCRAESSLSACDVQTRRKRRLPCCLVFFCQTAIRVFSLIFTV